MEIAVWQLVRTMSSNSSNLTDLERLEITRKKTIPTMFCGKNLKSLESKANGCLFTLDSVSGEHVTPAAINWRIKGSQLNQCYWKLEQVRLQPIYEDKKYDYGQI